MMNEMEISRRTWTAAIRLAVVLSVVAALVAVVAESFGGVPQAAIVLPVIVIAFATSWVHTERVRRRAIDDLLIVPQESIPTSRAA